MKLGSLKLDTAKESDGVWFDYIGGIRLKIARMGCPLYRSVAAELGAQDLDVIQTGDTKSKRFDTIQKKIAARSLLKGWEHLEDDEGNAIEFSVEKAEELLLDEELGHLYDFLIVQSNNLERFLRGKEEEMSKN
jgi:hypothetical protein